MRTSDRTKPKAGSTITRDKDALKERVRNMKKTLDAPKYIGSEEELVPFSWRYPLVMLESERKMNKVYKNIVTLEKSLTFRNSK